MNKFYDTKQVNLVLNGYTVTGYTEDSFINIEPLTKEKFTTQAGAQGDFSYSKNHDERTKITITLLQNSPSHLVLKNLADIENLFPVTISNTSDGKYIGSGSQAMVMERPTIEFGKELKEIEWVIVVGDYKDSF